MELIYAIKNKNKNEKDERKRRKQEIDELREDGIFRVALNKDIEIIRTLLSDLDVEHVDIEVNPKYLTNFHRALYFEEMKEFEWRQGKDNMFRFRRKEIIF